MADLQLAISNADDLAVSQLCSLAHLDQTRSLDSRKERLRSFLAGPSRRQRSGWLQFFLHVVGTGAVGPSPAFEVDYDELDHPDQELLADYIQFYHLGGAFLRAPPVDILNSGNLRVYLRSKGRYLHVQSTTTAYGLVETLWSSFAATEEERC